MRIRLQVLYFAIARAALHAPTRMVYPFLAVLARGMGVEINTISLIVSLRALVATLSPLYVSLANWRGTRVGMSIGLGVFIFSAALVTFLPGFPTFALALVLMLVGGIIFVNTMQGYLGGAIPYEKRGVLMALAELGWSFSLIFGVPFAGWLIARGGWSAPFPAFAVLGVVFLILLLWGVFPKEKNRQNTPSAASFAIKNLKTVFASPQALLGMALFIGFSASNEVVNLVFGVWLEDTQGMDIAALAGATAVIGLSELLGELLTSWIIDRLGKRRSIIYGLVGSLAVSLALPYMGGSRALAVAGLFLFFITFEFTIVSSTIFMSEVEPESRVTLMST
jgi:predicted MFS family arabinose efflux permease